MLNELVGQAVGYFKQGATACNHTEEEQSRGEAFIDAVRMCQEEGNEDLEQYLNGWALMWAATNVINADVPHFDSCWLFRD